MQPKVGKSSIEIPMTFDTVSNRESITIPRILLGLLILVGGLLLGILFLIFAQEQYKFWIILAMLGLFLYVRYGFLQEAYYAKRLDSLIATDYTFGTGLYWGIYEISEYPPYVCKMSNGLMCIFIAFDKDVIVGRDENEDYRHYEAISNAYNIMCKKGIWCIHIDYGDTIGKDNRMDSIFQNVMKAENADIRQEVIGMFDYIRSYMYRAYSSYDVYAFYAPKSSLRPEMFWDDLQPVLNAMLEANYVQYRMMDRREIAQLCKTLFNLTEFGVTKACESVFVSNIKSDTYVKVIWTEKNGERVVVNRTKEEIMAENRVKRAETALQYNRKKRERFKWLKRKRGKELEIDLGEDMPIESEEAKEAKEAINEPPTEQVENQAGVSGVAKNDYEDIEIDTDIVGASPNKTRDGYEGDGEVLYSWGQGTDKKKDDE